MKWRGKFGLVGAALMAVFLSRPTPSQACDVIESPRPLDRDIARLMVERATYVELAVAEARQPFDLEALVATRLAAAGPDERRSLSWGLENYRSSAATVTFRVVETLKGPRVDTFQLNMLVGVGADTAARREEARRRRDFRGRDDHWNLNSYWRHTGFLDETADILDSCWEAESAELGAGYLVFRDETGRVLDAELRFAWPRSGDRFTLAGPTFEEVFEPGDPWVRRVRRETERLTAAR